MSTSASRFLDCSSSFRLAVSSFFNWPDCLAVKWAMKASRSACAVCTTVCIACKTASRRCRAFYCMGRTFFLVAVVFAANIGVFAFVPASAPAKIMGAAAVSTLYHTRQHIHFPQLGRTPLVCPYPLHNVPQFPVNNRFMGVFHPVAFFFRHLDYKVAFVGRFVRLAAHLYADIVRVFQNTGNRCLLYTSPSPRDRG